jgi:hypothetical protein
MRKLRKQRAIAYLDRNDVLRTDDIGVIYQHVRWWYIDCDYRPAPIIRKTGKGKFVTTGELKLVPVRHRDADRRKPRRASGSSPTSSAAARACRVTSCRCSGRPLDLRRTRLLPSAS